MVSSSPSHGILLHRERARALESCAHRGYELVDAWSGEAGGRRRIYLPSEEGDVFVIAAGERFERLARNSMGAPLFATPAVAGSLLIVRTVRQVVAVGR